MVAVLAIGVFVAKLSVELSQRTTAPVCPDKVSKPLVAPLQTVVPPETVPATVAVFTTIEPVAVPPLQPPTKVTV